MGDGMIRRIGAPKKSQRARDKVSEEIALEHIYKFFVRKTALRRLRRCKDY